jgi:hypothetical protein
VIWSVAGERTVSSVSVAGTTTIASMTTTIHALKREPERVDLGSYMADLLKFSIIPLFSAAPSECKGVDGRHGKEHEADRR